MNCRFEHGLGLPCPACMKNQIPILEKENEERIKNNAPLDEDGNLLLHDVENIKRVVKNWLNAL